MELPPGTRLGPYEVIAPLGTGGPAFAGLVGLVQNVLQEDPLSNCLYVFFNRGGNYVKLVTWDRTGYCLFAKQLERGRFSLPSGAAKQEISE